MKLFTFLFAFILIGLYTNAQTVFTKADTLRGSLNENRDWFDVKRYTLHINPNLEAHSLDESSVSWDCQVLKPYQKIQIDLQQPLIINSIYFSVVTKMNGYFLNKVNSKKINFIREGNIAIANIDTILKKGDYFSISIGYHGKPREAVRPPWDGGWIWKKDSNGKPWVSVACQGLGASVWYPCKDIQSDEPDDGVRIFLKRFEGLESISNGRSVLEEEGAHRMGDWIVNSPINNYNVVPYIGDYIHWSEKYKGLKGDLDIDYWVLREDSAKAIKQFTQVPEMIKAFEYWFGPYPFYEDGFKMVQSPHLGMEHQSAIAYGNKFANGYLGRDLSGSGWGLKWDFIIVHESGHEWFANNITTKDIADMWVHEGFTNYSETLFTEFYYGKEAGNEYSVGSRRTIRNDKPIIGHYGVNEEGSGDMYAKAGSMIHNIRHAMNNDSLFRSILIGLNKDFYQQTVTTQQIENYISSKSGTNFSKVFDQYLRTIQIPTFSYSYDEKEKLLTYQWKTCVAGFDMPLNFKFEGADFTFLPSDYQAQKRLIKLAHFDTKAFADAIKRQYYVEVKME
jgi:aminopeptidase N